MRPLFLLCISLSLFNCVQKTHLKTVTFKVDMSSVQEVDNVGIKGNFTPNSWQDTFPLNDDNNDGIFEGTFSETTAINQIQFKFVNQNEQYELQGLENRIISFKYRPETIVYEAKFNDPNGVQTLTQ